MPIQDSQVAAMQQMRPYIGGGGQLQGWPQPAAPRDEYANRIAVERREHDATLTFYRDGGKAAKRVACITVPLAVLDALMKEKD